MTYQNPQSSDDGNQLQQNWNFKSNSVTIHIHNFEAMYVNCKYVLNIYMLFNAIDINAKLM